MLTDSPTTRPPIADPELLIREARARQRRRRLYVAAAICAGAGLGALAWGALGRGEAGSGTAGAPVAVIASNRCPGTDLGEVAYVRAGALDVVDFRHCTPRTLVRRGVTGTPVWSRDGRYIAFGRGFVAAAGGAVHPLPSQPVWAPGRDLLAYAARGEVWLRSPGAAPRPLVAGSAPTFSPDGGTIAFVGADLSLRTVPTGGGPQRVLARFANAQPIPVGFSPDGRWFLYHVYPDAASLAADGMELVAVDVATGRRVTIATTLGRSDLVTWCGRRLAFATAPHGRFVAQGAGISVAAPPAWKPLAVLASGGRTSWNALACHGGTLAVSAGPSSQDTPFGHEARSLWLVPARPHATPHLLARTAPANRLTDELPMWSSDGRYLAFVRTAPRGVRGHGSLFVYDRRSQRVLGPVARVGSTGNYYGSYGWAEQIAWHR